MNRLVTSDDSGASGLRSFSYDSRGNVTAAGALQFSYDAENQPISVSGSSSGNYVYDGNLKRVKQTVNGATIYNVYDQAGQLVHVDKRDAGKSTDYIHGAQGTLARITNNAVTYLHHDSLGSAQSGTDSSGAILWLEAYTPYGEALNDVSANQDLAGFTGHIKDDATGLSYMQARYYDPVIGRFYSNDPVGYVTRNPVFSFNRYSYVSNNPYKYVDPNGEEKISIGYEAELVVIAGVKVSGSVSYDTDTGEISASAQAGPRLGLGAALGPTVSVTQSDTKAAKTELGDVEIAVTGEAAIGPFGLSGDLMSEKTLADAAKTSAGTGGLDSGQGGESKGKFKFKPGASLTVGLEASREATSDIFAEKK
ncbi:RHS repeat-associated core domain-containing protein [Pseudidiomarina sp.]|uniref:RHS repeat-associated core domain-containing protein n=1 Tax=Pseudidiomarina sp. TaxID=2081707 RepID=UPI003A983C37